MSRQHNSFQLQSKFAQLLGHIRRSQLEEIKQMIEQTPALLHMRDRNGRTVVHHCADNFATTTSAFSQTVNIAQLFLARLAELAEAQDNEGNTALHLSVINGNQQLTRTLLQSMTIRQINIGDFEMHTAVHWATVCGELDCLSLVLDAGAEVSSADIFGAHPLHYATQSVGELVTNSNINSSHYGSQLRFVARRANGLRILHHLLCRQHVDVNCMDNEGRTPLLWSASSGNHDALLALVKSGAEVSQQDKDGLSALHCASSRGHYKCLEILIMICGADVQQTDSSGCTPLFYATALGHADCVRLLLDSNADLDHQDNKGRTAAHCGAAKGQLETLKMLHQHGANFEIKNVRGDLPIHEAVKSGRKDLVQWLLEIWPKSVNEVNLYGRSPLHIAAFNNNIELCKLLVSFGADLNSVMKVRSQYLTPLDAAFQNASEEVANYLQQQGAQPIAQINEKVNSYLHQQSSNPESNVFQLNNGHEQVDADTLSRQRRKVSANPNESVKLPNLVHDTNGKNQRVLSTGSSTSMVHDGGKVHNVREYEMQLGDKPTHLRQAIITNVYVTSPVPVGSNGQPSAVYYVKRVPPLKKGVGVKKKRSSLANGARNRHSSMTPTRTDVKEESHLDDNLDETRKVLVTLETHDTFQSQIETREEKFFLKERLSTENMNNIEPQGARMETRGSIDQMSILLDDQSDDKQHASQTYFDDRSADSSEIDEKQVRRPSDFKMVRQQTVVKRSVDESEDGNSKEMYCSNNDDMDEHIVDTNEKRIEDSVLRDFVRSVDNSKQGQMEDAFKKSTESVADEVKDVDSESRRQSESAQILTVSPSCTEFDKSTLNYMIGDPNDKNDDVGDQFEYRNDLTQIDEEFIMNEDEDLLMADNMPIGDQSACDPPSDLFQRIDTEDTFDQQQTYSIEESQSLKEIEKDNQIVSSFNFVKKSSVQSEPENGSFAKQISTEELAIQSKDTEIKSVEEDNAEEGSAEEKSFEEGNAQEVSVEEGNAQERVSDERNAEVGISEKDNAEEGISEKDNAEEGISEEDNAEEGISEKDNDEEGIYEKDNAEEGIYEKDNAEEGISEKDDADEGVSEKDYAEEGVSEKDNTEEDVEIGKDEEVDAENAIDKGESVKVTQRVSEDDNLVDYQVKSELSEHKDEKELRHKSIEDFSNEEGFEQHFDNKQEVDKELTAAEIDGVINSDDEQLNLTNQLESENYTVEQHVNMSLMEKASLECLDSEQSEGNIDQGTDLEQEKTKLNDEINESMVDDEKLEAQTTCAMAQRNSARIGQNICEQEIINQIEQRKPSLASDDREEISSQIIDQEKKESVCDSDNLSEESLIEDGRQTKLLQPSTYLAPQKMDRRRKQSMFMPNGENLIGKSSQDTHVRPTETDDGYSKVEGQNTKFDLTASEEDLRSDFTDDFHKEDNRGSYDNITPLASTSSPFGTVRQLKGKKKAYDHVRPKVDSFWNDNRHYIGQYNKSNRKKPKFGGSVGYLVSGADEEYAQIDPKIINQTVEKYLRKYYLERKLFEELYDLKRYQIRTGKANEPQFVKRLLEKFRREVKAPGMVDFNGPYTYRAYEMYIYDLLRKLSRSNEKKIAFLKKSISYDDINSSSFEHHGDTTDDGRCATPPEDTTGRDPLFDYDHVPHGLSVDYKYEYHQSQHVSRHHKGDVVDVICENLYKRTGMHGSKLDELAITRKVVERKDNPKRSDDQQHSTEQKPNSATNGAVAEQAEQAESASKSPPTLKKVKKAHVQKGQDDDST